MTKFNYKAKKNPKESERGVVEADSKAGAISKLTEKGLVPIEIEQVDNAYLFENEKIKISLKNLIFFTREISDLINSGVSLVDAVKLISSQTKNEKLKFISITLLQDIKEGGSLSNSLTKFSKVFNPLYVNVVKSGEISGKLEKVLEKLADHLERKNSIHNKMWEAVAYPIFLVVMGVCAISVLVTYVIPKMMPIFNDMGASLPFVTVLVLKFSKFLTNNFYLILILLVCLFYFIKKIFASHYMKTFFRNHIIKIPVLNDFFTAMYLSDIFESLETLISNGISTVLAIDVTYNNAPLKPFYYDLSVVKEKIANGSSFSESLKEFSSFPPKVYTIIKVGEKSGNLNNALNKLAKSYTQYFNKAATILTKVASPLFIILIAFMIAVIIIAMLLPILNINMAF